MRRLVVGVVWLLAALLLGGCNVGGLLRSGPDVPLELDYNRLLPEGWSPITQWYELNVDDDSDTEYLLLFTYDMGQVGAVIYDQQVSTDLAAPLEAEPSGGARVGAPLQAFGYYRPYLLLPSNWDFTYGGAVSHGFVAHPRDVNAIVVSQVVRRGNVLAEAFGLGPAADEEFTHPAAEAVIQGGATHLTFVWWKNRREGYGVTQLYAPGGFRGINWPIWRENPTPINEISGLFPLVDYRARSLLCLETEYTRRGVDPNTPFAEPGPGDAIDATRVPTAAPALPVPTDIAPAADGNMATDPVETQPGAIDTVTSTEPLTDGLPLVRLEDESTGDGLRPMIAFAARNLGIRFCTERIPVYPFYPEGVTLAYLRGVQENGGGASPLLSSNLSRGIFEETLSPVRLANERINDIEAYPTVPVALDVVGNGSFSPTTSVCVELANLDNVSERRWLLFTLRYHAPDMAARTAERWSIAGVAQQPPAPAGAASGYCRAILGLN